MKFQFSTRDLLILVAFIALAAGWWIDHQRISRLAVQQWEYKRAVLNNEIPDMDTLGDDGWELCRNDPRPVSSGGIL